MKRSSTEREEAIAGLPSHGESTPLPLPGAISRRSLLARVLAWSGAGAILTSLVPGESRAEDTPGYGVKTISTMPGGRPNRTRGQLFEEVLHSSFRIVPDPNSAAPMILLNPGPEQQHPRVAAHQKIQQEQAAAPLLVPNPMAMPRMVVLSSVVHSRTTTKPGRKGPPPTPRFSLIFRDVNGPALPQNTYRVEHAELGVFPLFLVPIGPKRGEVSYQAIFG
jgi:hypothetical protein